MRSKVRSLDEYQRYIKQHEQVTADKGNEGAAPPPAAPVKKQKAVAPPAAAPNTRYVLRGGVTVAVEEAEAVVAAAEEVPPPPVAAPVPKPTRKPAPKAVTALDLSDTQAPDADDMEKLTGDAALLPASLWERLPRHIQLLAQIPAPLEEEVAQKYYTRGFRESREELIERLLDPPLTLEDTARVLGVCPATVRRYTNRGVLLHQRTVGQQRRFRLSDVLLFLEKQQNKSAAVPARRPKKS